MPSAALFVRRAHAKDRARILEISSQIWDGDDYVPELLDDWLTEDTGELVVAELEGTLVAFAHRTWLHPGVAWFQGIRTDPACQGRGAGKAIAEFLISGARQAGASRIVLSTYIDNTASIHILESRGFHCVGTFSHLERPAATQMEPIHRKEQSAEKLSEEEFRAFVRRSKALELGNGWFSRGWRFFPFELDPKEATARLSYRMGLRAEGRLVGAVGIRQALGLDGPITMNFLDGSQDAVQELAARVLEDYAGRAIETMVPIRDGCHSKSLSVLKGLGFISYSEFAPDVFVYTMDV